MGYIQSAVVADGVTDNTATLTSELTSVASNGGSLILPPGNILVKTPISITGSKPFSVFGAGPAITQIVGFLTFKACHYMHLENFGVTATSKLTSGTLLSLFSSFRVSLDHISVSEGYRNLLLGNMVGGTFHRLYLSGGTFFSGPQAGSYNLLVDAAPDGVNNGLDFDGCYFEGSQTGLSNYDESIRINNVDGCWFRGGHIYGGHNVQAVINGGPAVTAVTFNGVYIEHGPLYGIIFQNPNNTVDGITINACQFNGQTYPLAVNGHAPSACVITNNRGLKTPPVFPSSVVGNNI